MSDKNKGVDMLKNVSHILKSSFLLVLVIPIKYGASFLTIQSNCCCFRGSIIGLVISRETFNVERFPDLFIQSLCF